MDQLKTLFADLGNWFSRLTARERQLVLIAGGAASAFVLFLLVFSFASSASAYRKRIDYKLGKMQEVQQLAANFRESEAQRQQVEAQLTGTEVRLGAYLEEKFTASGLTPPPYAPRPDSPLGDGNIVESSIEFTLPDTNLGKLVDFLTKVEAGPGMVKVTQLRLEPRVASETLTAWVTVSTYSLKAQ
jgi:general secretion pathway protein M